MTVKIQKAGEKHWILSTLMTVLLFVFIISASVTLVLAFRPFYYLEARIFKIPETTGYSLDVCKRNYDTLIQYNLLFGPNVLVFPDFSMSPAGAQHFREVKAIFLVLQYAAIGSGLLLVPTAIAARKRGAIGWRRALVITLVAVVLAVGLAILIDGDGTFTLMHKILFRNDYWIFNPITDPIINILPFEVFISDGVLILVFVTLGLVLAEVFSKPKALKTQKNVKAKNNAKSQSAAKKPAKKGK